jgi:uncharacterized membrane protein
MPSKKSIPPAPQSPAGTPELISALNVAKSPVDKFAVSLVKMLGSIRFLLVCIVLFSVWICWNLGFFNLPPFDPFPFPTLQMGVSLFAIILSVSVLINQNRQGHVERIQKQVEFEVNVRAEAEATKMLNMLHEIQQKLGIGTEIDKELEELKTPTDIKEIHERLDGEAGRG